MVVFAMHTVVGNADYEIKDPCDPATTGSVKDAVCLRFGVS